MPRWRLLGLALTICVAGALGACGNDSEKAQPSSSSLSPSSTDVLSGADLKRLVVDAPPPFVQVPDDVAKTGLMEVGNPNAGKIEIAFAAKHQIVAAGFQRGWEKAFRSADGSILLINVSQFANANGPKELVDMFVSSRPPEYRPLSVADVPVAGGFSGTTEEGRAFLGTAFAEGRFLAALSLRGGPPGAHDYNSLITNLTTEQFHRVKG